MTYGQFMITRYRRKNKFDQDISGRLKQDTMNLYITSDTKNRIKSNTKLQRK